MDRRLGGMKNECRRRCLGFCPKFGSAAEDWPGLLSSIPDFWAWRLQADVKAVVTSFMIAAMPSQGVSCPESIRLVYGIDVVARETQPLAQLVARAGMEGINWLNQPTSLRGPWNLVGMLLCSGLCSKGRTDKRRKLKGGSRRAVSFGSHLLSVGVGCE